MATTTNVTSNYAGQAAQNKDVQDFVGREHLQFNLDKVYITEIQMQEVDTIHDTTEDHQHRHNHNPIVQIQQLLLVQR